MAEVYRGTQRGAEGFSKTVAVKRVLPGYSNDPQFAEMFVAEATIASRLMHPNVVAVTDFDRDTAGRLFLVMELVEGRDLRALMTTGRLPPSIVVYIVSELLRALGYAHALHHEGRPMQIVHRDVSPHNVLVSWDGAVKLSDFGIAKAAEASPATRTGVVKGKAAYLSPEQARAESLDHRSDLFAAGVVLYELLTDRRLFAVQGGAREAVIIHRVLNLEYPSPRDVHADISEALDGVCRWLLARDRDQRPADAFEALDALLACPEASARGARALAEVMRERFGREAPSLTTPAHSGPVYETPSKPPVGDFTDSEIDAREAAYNLRSVAVDPVARVPTKTEPSGFATGLELTPSAEHGSAANDVGRGERPSSADARAHRGPSPSASVDTAAANRVNGSAEPVASGPPRRDAPDDARAASSTAPASARGLEEGPPRPSASTAGGARSDRISGPTAVRTSAEGSRWPAAKTQSTAPGSLVPGTLADSAPTRHTPNPALPQKRGAWWAAFVVLAVAAVGLAYLNWRPANGEAAAGLDAVVEEAQPSAHEARGSAADGPGVADVEADEAQPTSRDGARATESDADEVDTTGSEVAPPATPDVDRDDDPTASQKRPTRTKRRRRRTTPAPPPPPPPEPTKPKKVGDDLLSPDL